MQRIRMIPVLLLKENGLFKTIRFKNPTYVGDPINTVKIFNEKGADEIVILDISVTRDSKPINFKKITELAGEAFMPLAYGGGIKTFDDAQKIFDAGFEKVVLNSSAAENPGLVTKIANAYGSQSAVVSIDAKPNWMGTYKVYTKGGSNNTNHSPDTYAKDMEKAGVGEIIINAINNDGTWQGYDIHLIKMVSNVVKVPVVACGGAASMNDFKKAIDEGGASAVAAGSMFVYQKKGMGVLISFPAEGLKI